MRDSLAFFLGYVVSYFTAAGIYLYNIWDTLYPSLVIIDYGLVVLGSFCMVMPAFLFMLVNVIIRDS